MKTLAKFVLERSNQAFYIEKIQNNQHAIIYIMYDNAKQKIIYNQHNFHAIFGADVKISIQKFTSTALNVLIHGISNSEKVEKSYNYFVSLSNKLQNLNKENPKLEEKLFVEAIDVYNAIKQNKLDLEIDYNENYELVNGLLNEEIEREHVVVIKNNYNQNLKENYSANENIITEENKVERIRKYD